MKPANTSADDAAEDDVPPTDYSEDGVDLTVIRWMLSLTPAERLRILEDRVNNDPTDPGAKCNQVISFACSRYYAKPM